MPVPSPSTTGAATLPEDGAGAGTRTGPGADPLAAAVAWLWSQQRPDGSWRSDRYPFFRAGHALTPTVLHALLSVPESRAPRPAGGVERALLFLRATIAEDGTIGVDGPVVAEYPTYAAAYSLRCLVAAGAPADEPLRERLGHALANAQLRDTLGFPPEHPAHGAWSFGPLPAGSPGHVDLSIARHVLEALREAGLLARDEALARRGTIRERAERFLARVQNLPAPLDGGFFLSPVVTAANKAGMAIDPGTGEERFVSYASATAEGLLALLALGIERSDPRVEAARRWLVELHPRIDIHEGIPPDDATGWQDGLRLYHLAVRAEAHASIGGPERWRDDVARGLEGFQGANGSFANPAGALMKEDDPLLATTLAVIALAATER